MKVLIIGPLVPPVDGCSYANEILIKNLSIQNIEYETINTNTHIISSDQGTHFSFLKAVSFLKTYLLLPKLFPVDIVYLTPGQTFFGILKYAPFIFFCIALKKPYVIHLHGNYLGKEYSVLKGLKKKFFFSLISHAAAGIVLSKSLKKNFTELLSTDKIFVVENFADNSLYENKNIVKLTDIPRIIYLSNLMLEKGIVDFLDALLILKHDKIPFKATIAGQVEADIKDIVKEKIEQLGESAEYVGIISGVYKNNKLMQSNIFILPTYYKMEGQPISIIEGLATGNIIVTTPHAGIPDIIDSSNGFFILPCNPSSISDMIKKIGENLEENMNKFSSHNVEYAASKFTEKFFSGKVISVLKIVHSQKIYR
jgi:glycosyltransferase involved in cell wall biosynthesis